MPSLDRAHRSPLPAVAALTLLVVAAAGVPGVAARTIAVPDEVPTIGEAMQGARAGDIILVGCGVYREHDIRVRPGVSLWSGTLQPDCVVIDAGGRGRVLIFEACDGTTAVVGLTLRGGRSDGDGGAVLCKDGAPRISRCIIQGSSARRGGGLLATGNAAPQLEDCVFTDNSAVLHGGGVAWDTDAIGRIQRGTFERNEALAGGGLAVLRGDALVLDQVTFAANVAAGSGGGVWMGRGAPELRHCLLVGNHGGLGGGGLALRGGNPRVVSCTIADNVAEVAGAGVLVRDASPLIDHTIIAFNQASSLVIAGAGRPRLSATNLYGHRDGDWVGAVATQARQNGNFTGDPRFCGRAAGRYDLRAGSPCLPGGRPGADALVGALDRGCN